ncbi:Peptidoglycan/xylan/chitin deacetylase, PgdA/CDA1 family [Geodermatophilus pulveris]|uniref:Peptidoglycan/xylan/chitin deacetylase, PgdA/CDA1 family n=1 Tax=Geodermatophilus pulveris TaxID=1564159 RepID=A0A239C7C6_9ACTN|nr:polysaccharide deacetylase family protein [Geodermatophilus pulveris]SNS15849.1 Peptidoglycan/xylan/chitin deacetylase, PgdA/CDA1 family [Geodermatophilus pulveris]
MNPRKPSGAVRTLVLAVLAGSVVAVPSAAAAAPRTAPCGPTYDHVLTGTPATAPRTVALTFDDGPSPRWTPQVLDVLRRNRVKATFYLVGAQVERFPELARRIAAEGHTIGNHSWDHPHFAGSSRQDQAWQMDRTTEVIRRTTGVTPCSFRAPYGQASDVTLSVARERGMNVANWTHDTADYDTPGHRSAGFRQQLVARATVPWHDHADVLMHDGSDGGFRQNTVDAVQPIIDHYRRHGYYFTDVTGRWSGTWISDHYERTNGEWTLGAPVSGEVRLPGGRGWVTTYQRGSIHHGRATGVRTVRGAIWERHQQLGHATGPLGMPVADEALTADRRGVYQHFQGGSIYWTARTGAWEVFGGIRRRWAELGRERGLGYPVSGETATADGVGRFTVFERGTVYWSPATGAHEVRGAIRTRWGRLGAERGLGYPTGSERRTADGRGVYQQFQRGAVYWSPATGARELRGAIRDRWVRAGRETGSLGYPTGAERLLPGGGVAQTFQRGLVYWSPGSGAHVVRPGTIHDRWVSLGAAGGVLGYPVGEQRALPGSGGAVQSFQGGHVHWSPATGSQAVLNGPIRDRWVSLGAEDGVLGHPRAGVVTTGAGSVQDFVGGSVAWTASAGAQVLRGGARDAWIRLGRESGALGLPTSGQHTGAAAGTTWTSFTGGVLYTTPEGPVPVLGGFAAAWRAEGGDAGIGRPLSAAAAGSDGVLRQEFAGGVLEQGPDGTVAPQATTAAAVGSAAVAVDPAEGVAPQPQAADAAVDEPATSAPAQVRGAPVEETPGEGTPPAPAGTLVGSGVPAGTDGAAGTEQQPTGAAATD